MNEIEELILRYAEKVGQFKTSELACYLRSKQKDVQTGSLHYFLNKLIKQQKLVRKTRGLYSSLVIKPDFSVRITEGMRNVFAMLHNALPFAGFCLYNGSDLTQFQHNMAANNVIYVETQRDTCDSAFNILKEAGKVVYLHPKREMIGRYIDLSETLIIVKPLTSESPVSRTDDGMCVPTLEKLLVDINADEDFFYLQEEEAFYIFRNASDRFLINEARLLRYARRRNLEALIKKQIEEVEL